MKLAPPAQKPVTPRLIITSIVAASALMLSGCGGSSSSDGHDHTEIETAGRLAIYDSTGSQIKVMDLDDGSILEQFPLDGEAPRLYRSPNARYGVVIQRGDDLVSFVDSGLYTEDHGDHMHDYAETPSMLSLTLNDHRPTHYSLGEEYGVVFYDGAASAANAKVTVFSDHSLESNSEVASLGRDNNMHGVAKMVGDRLFVTRRDSSITDTTLPAEVERYQLDGGSFTHEHLYAEQCPRLHGAAANHHALAFGCSDGVLVIDLEDDAFPAEKLDNPPTLIDGSRIGTLVAHHDVDALVGIAGNQLFVINPEDAEPYLELTLGEGVTRIAQGFDGHGETFYVFGNDGKLRLFDPADGWLLVATLEVMEPLAEGDQVAFTESASEDRLFALTPDGQSIIEIDTHEREVLRTIALDFQAASLVWLGLMDDHDHDHAH
uniref:5-methyltetrahydrofolate--homocysteine methyltransferase n=1 Tax=Marinobacter nauticus TaxID=2743 RepID=A0A455WAK4_MARNT|nr:hypothetical protein YBY_03660 [Marinobacter nauticus]